MIYKDIWMLLIIFIGIIKILVKIDIKDIFVLLL